VYPWADPQIRRGNDTIPASSLATDSGSPYRPVASCSHTRKDPDSDDPHQEWVTFVKQTGGPPLFPK